jgi:hypothetical protein
MVIMAHQYPEKMIPKFISQLLMCVHHHTVCVFEWYAHIVFHVTRRMRARMIRLVL